MQNILITGASSGLGKSLAISYANKDTNLFLIGRNKENLEKVKKICENKGSAVVTRAIDVCDKNSMKIFIESVDFDIIFANAGVSAGVVDGFRDEVLYKVANTNMFGVLNTITPAISNMIKNKKGRIVLISSMASFRGLSSAPIYSASKAFVRYYGEALNNNLKKYNINVNIVCPGFIKTPLTDKNKFYMPFLMSADNAVRKIKIGIEKNKKFIIFPKVLYYSIKFLLSLPFGLDDWIFSKLPEK